MVCCQEEYIWKMASGLIFILCVWPLSDCIYVHYMMAGAHGGQKRDLDLLELDLQIVMSCHVGFWVS